MKNYNKVYITIIIVLLAILAGGFWYSQSNGLNLVQKEPKYTIRFHNISVDSKEKLDIIAMDHEIRYFEAVVNYKSLGIVAKKSMYAGYKTLYSGYIGAFTTMNEAINFRAKLPKEEEFSIHPILNEK